MGRPGWIQIPRPCHFHPYGYVDGIYYTIRCDECYLDKSAVVEWRDRDLYDRRTTHSSSYNGLYYDRRGLEDNPVDGCKAVGVYSYNHTILDGGLELPNPSGNFVPNPYGWQLVTRSTRLYGTAWCRYKTEVYTGGSTSQWVYDSTSRSISVSAIEVVDAYRYDYYQVAWSSTYTDPTPMSALRSHPSVTTELSREQGYDSNGYPITSVVRRRVFSWQEHNPSTAPK